DPVTLSTFLTAFTIVFVTGSVLEVSVRPGDNITLYCDCKKSTGVYIVWYRNCSHDHQPPLILKITRNQAGFFLKISPRFMFVDNTSSNSLDLLIMNITESDEGIYYCGTQHTKVEGKDHIGSKYDHSYGNIKTRIILSKLKVAYRIYCWSELKI
uniref:Ig-like domain-containing protein n=1 Tax=Sparus aurata TaxID=8175 RepID=A0A671XFY5_SPAAU